MGKSNFMFCVLLCVLIGMPTMAEVSSYTLADALKKNLVTATLKSRAESSSAHYGQCITLVLKNKTSQKLSLSLENGRRLDCTNDSIQDLLVTRGEILALLPAKQQEYTIYAMCAEKQNRSPRKNSIFVMGGMAESMIVQLTLLIEKLGAQNYTGQQAVWVLTNNDNPEGISGDSVTVKALRGYLVNALAGKKKFAREKGVIYDYSFPTQEGNAFTIEGELTWQMPYNNYTSLYIYDNYGNRVTVVFQDVLYKAGFQTYQYKITSSDFRPGELYWVRVKTKDKLLKEVAIQMD